MKRTLVELLRDLFSPRSGQLYRVRYRPNRWINRPHYSIVMTWHTANAYAETFNGDVVREVEFTESA